MSRSPARLLHLFASFDAGGKELRAVRLMNALGRGAEHHIVSGEPDAMGAARQIDRNVAVHTPKDFPALKGRPTPGRLQKLAKATKPFDLVLTYNWGAMDAVLANTLFRDALNLPRLIHHEDGFNEDEQHRLKRRRNFYRRIALGKAAGLVVPSRMLERIAIDVWHQPPRRVIRIPNGIDLGAFGNRPKPTALRGMVKRKGERWVGTLAGLRPVKALPRLVRAIADLPDDWQLVVVGEGEKREAIREEAVRLDISHRVHLPGFAPDPARYVGLFDIFALSSTSEQHPIALVEAMAAGLPVAAMDAGDIAAMVAEENQRFVTTQGDEAALARSLADLAEDAGLRARLGKANRARAKDEFGEEAMIATYRRLYESALKRPL